MGEPNTEKSTVGTGSNPSPATTAPPGAGGLPPAEEGTQAGHRLDRSLLLVAAVAVGLVVITLLIAALAGRQPPASFPEGSPEARVQAYMVALERGDTAASYAMMSEAFRREVTAVEFADRDAWFPEDAEIVVRNREEQGDRAFLTLVVRTGGRGLFGGEAYEYEERVTLIREAGEWRFERQPTL